QVLQCLFTTFVVLTEFLNKFPQLHERVPYFCQKTELCTDANSVPKRCHVLYWLLPHEINLTLHVHFEKPLVHENKRVPLRIQRSEMDANVWISLILNIVLITRAI